MVGICTSEIFYLPTVDRKDENKEKEAENGPSLKDQASFLKPRFRWIQFGYVAKEAGAAMI